MFCIPFVEVLWIQLNTLSHILYYFIIRRNARVWMIRFSQGLSNQKLRFMITLLQFI